jgi:hypothetical protein
MSGFPSDWSQEAKNGLTILATSVVQQARNDPGEWVSGSSPLRAEVLYDEEADEFQLHRNGYEGDNATFRFDDEDILIDQLTKIWGKEIYDGNWDRSLIEHLKVIGVM